MGLPKLGSMETRVFIDINKIKAYINCSWGDTPSVGCKIVFSYLCSFESNVQGEVEGP